MVLRSAAKPGGDRKEPLFPKWSNSVLWSALFILAFSIVATPPFLMMAARTPYFTGQDVPRQQPLQFDHRHHVRDDGIDCLYCHFSARRAQFAGMPSTSLCMNCHNQIWIESPEVAAVRTSQIEDTPIVWTKVTNIPGFAYFDHSIHVAKGVGCSTCHGRVDLMGKVYQKETLLMSWCLRCHRMPERFLRPRDKITDMDWKTGDLELGRRLVREYDVHPGTDCTTCHR